MPSGCPSAMAPPFGLTCAASSGRPSRRSTASACEAKASLSSITSKSPIESPSRAISFSEAGAGPMPMMRGGTPATAAPSIRARGRRPCRFAARFARDEERAGAVVDARGIAGRHRAAGAKRRAELRERLEARLARMLVAVDDRRIALLRRQRHRDDLRREPAVRLRGERALLAAEREGVLVGARHGEFRRHVLARLRHRVDAVLLLHERIDEAPADRRVEHLLIAREGRIGLRQHVGRAAHALGAARDHETPPRPTASGARRSRPRRVPSRRGGSR